MAPVVVASVVVASVVVVIVVVVTVVAVVVSSDESWDPLTHIRHRTFFFFLHFPSKNWQQF